MPRKFVVAAAAKRGVGIVANFASREEGSLFVQQSGQGAKDAALSLPAQSEQNEIMARKYCVDNLGDYGVVIADDAGKNCSATAKLGDQIIAQFVLYAPILKTLLGKRTAAEFAECPRETHSKKPPGSGYFWIIRPGGKGTDRADLAG